ncbi:MAG: AAA family ATPase, partial [Methanoregula sp.]|nr:AAA family ATPase [Methanoregula sp.]
MMSLLPDAVMKSLKSRFGSEFNELSKEQKLALATVAIEGSVTHARIKEISDIHPHDLSKELKDLVTHGFLQSAGATRAMVYTFPRPGLSESDDTVQTRLDGIAEQKGGSSVHLPDSSLHLVPSSVHLPDSSVHSALRTLVDERFLGRKKVSNILMEETILILCSGHFLTLDQLADFLKRSPETIRTHYLNQM